MTHDPDQDRRDWTREIVEDRERDARQTRFLASGPRDACEEYFAVDDAQCVECPLRTARGCAERANITIPEAYPRCAYADECMVCPLDCHRRKAIFERLPTPDLLPPTLDLPEPLPFTEPPPPKGDAPVVAEEGA